MKKEFTSQDVIDFVHYLNYHGTYSFMEFFEENSGDLNIVTGWIKDRIKNEKRDEKNPYFTVNLIGDDIYGNKYKKVFDYLKTINDDDLISDEIRGSIIDLVERYPDVEDNNEDYDDKIGMEKFFDHLIYDSLPSKEPSLIDEYYHLRGNMTISRLTKKDFIRRWEKFLEFMDNNNVYTKTLDFVKEFGNSRLFKKKE